MLPVCQRFILVNVTVNQIGMPLRILFPGKRLFILAKLLLQLAIDYYKIKSKSL